MGQPRATKTSNSAFLEGQKDMSHKILFVGPMGAGKTTAIAAVSDIPPITTEALNTDQVQCAKPTTTVAMDYGEIRLSNDEVTVLYGIPGQKRFRLNVAAYSPTGPWEQCYCSITAAPTPKKTWELYLQGFDATRPTGCGRDRSGTNAWGTDTRVYHKVLARLSCALPLFSVDVRERLTSSASCKH